MWSKDINLKGAIISFLTFDRIRLTGFLSSKKHSKRCIIYVHGTTSNFYSRLPLTLASYLAKHNVALFSINTRGHDFISSSKKEVKNDKKRKPIGTVFEYFEDCIFDIRAAVNTAEKLGFKEIILCGNSTGCQKITYYQYKYNDRRVKSLILVAPAEDYPILKKALGSKFKTVIDLCKRMIKKRRGDETDKRIPDGYSAQRFDSLTNLQRVESRLFNYDGKLNEFSSIKTPMHAIFGSNEEYAFKPVKTYLKILENRSTSKRFVSSIINGADHSFRDREKELANAILMHL